MALLMVLLATLLMSAVAASLALSSSTDSIIAGNFVRQQQARAAAEAVLDAAVADLSVADWSAVLSGAERSSFADGAPFGERSLDDGTALVLDEVANLANCGTRRPCGARLSTVTPARPWGVNNPVWQLYAYGPLEALAPGSLVPAVYVVALVADDQSENDGDPLSDGTGAANPGSGILSLRAEAFGSRGAHALITATLIRHQGSSPQMLSWRLAN
jgi:hypothetical protein